MTPILVKAVTGGKNISPEIRSDIESVTRKHISDKTGLPTLATMETFLPIIKQYGMTEGKNILSAAEYKRLYTDGMRQKISEKVARFQNGHAGPEDQMIAGALSFLKDLHKRGVKLILASGSDEADILEETRIFGFDKYFEGGIYGAKDGTGREAKGWAMGRVIQEIGADRMAFQFAGFGDGPVEIRETKKRNGYAVGIASDEERRQGFNLAKRERLVSAGADLLIGDFLEGGELLKFLGL